MTQTVDLNADMGEGFGRWTMGDDLGLLGVVTSANIACGMHAGDWDTMARTMRAAADKGVGIGAHPGFADLQGFGRRRLDMPAESLGNLVAYQLGAAIGMARSVGAEVRHLKLHGALANMASEDLGLALTCYRAARAVAPGIAIVAMAGTAQTQAATELGGPAAHEIFADRAYNDDATLADRRQPGAVIHDPAEIAQRISAMVAEGAMIAASGRRIPTRIDTICVHGDTPGALAAATGLAARLRQDGVTLAPFAR